MAEEISARDARRIALAAQGFAGRARRPSGRVDRRHFRRVLTELATVQLDSVNVLTRTHELVFFARLGNYDRDSLNRWLWSSREVFEYWGHMASVHPVERHPLFRWRMANRHQWGVLRTSANGDAVAAMRAAVRERGPVSMADLEPDGREPRKSSWWGWNEHKRLMEYLFWNGEVSATRRNGFERVYVAPEQWLPEEVLALPTPDERQAQRELLLVSARALGIGTPKDLADYYRMPVRTTTQLLEELADQGRLVRAAVEGWRQPAYLHPEARIPRRRLSNRALLSPFDSLIWDRQRTERVFDFHYRIEIYTPKPKRVHGYYVLPFLLDEALVARVDLKADRRAGELLVQAAWLEDPEAADVDRIAGELMAELQEMAAWLDLTNGVTVVGPGDLAPTLIRNLDTSAR